MRGGKRVEEGGPGETRRQEDCDGRTDEGGCDGARGSGDEEDLKGVDGSRQRNRVDGRQSRARSAGDDDPAVLRAQAEPIGRRGGERCGHLSGGDLASDRGPEADDDDLGEGVPHGPKRRHRRALHRGADRRDRLIAPEEEEPGQRADRSGQGEDSDAASGGGGAHGLQERARMHVPGQRLDPMQQVNARQADEAGNDAGGHGGCSEAAGVAQHSESSSRRALTLEKREVSTDTSSGVMSSRNRRRMTARWMSAALSKRVFPSSVRKTRPPRPSP